MKSTRFFTIVLVLALLVTPLAVLAQGDDELELEEYISEDELFSVMYPAGWLPFTESWFPFPHGFFANSEETLARISAEESTPMATGEMGLIVTVIPVDVLPFFGAMLTDDMEFADVAKTLVTAFETPEDPEEEMPEIGDVEEVEVDKDLTIALIPSNSTNGDSMFAVWMLGEDLFAMSMMGVAPGEWSEDYIDTLLTVSASISFEGTGAELLAALMAPPEIEEAPEGMTASDYDGEALVAERCTTCHSADRIYSADKDEAGWTATVDRMIGHGTQLNAAEREAVIAYLTEMQ